MTNPSIFIFADRPPSTDVKSIHFDRNLEDLITALRDRDHYVELWQQPYDPDCTQIQDTAQQHSKHNRDVIYVTDIEELQLDTGICANTVSDVGFDTEEFDLSNVLDGITNY